MTLPTASSWSRTAADSCSAAEPTASNRSDDAPPMRSTMPRASLTSSAVDLGVAAVSISWNLSVELPQLSTRIFMSPSAAAPKHRVQYHLYFLYLSFKIVAFAGTFASRLDVA